MAWFQNLAGKAEDILVRIDKNAATVLNDSGLKVSNTIEKGTTLNPMIETDDHLSYTDISSLFDSRENSSKDVTICTESLGFSDNISIISENSGLSDTEHGGISFPSKHGSPSLAESKYEAKTDTGEFHSKSSSLQNSFILYDDTPSKLEEKIMKLEQENEGLNEHLINMRHIIVQTQNDNSNLQNELDKIKENLLATEMEMEQYRARAQRILQEKEKLIALKEVGTNVDTLSNEQLMIAYNEGLKKELKFQEAKCTELSQKLAKANSDIHDLNRNIISLQITEQETKQKFQEFYMNEMHLRATAEAEYYNKTKELESTLEELTHLKNENTIKTKEISYLKEQAKKRQSYVVNEDLESRLQTLTQTLMHKQDTLETMTTERNALLLQLEKYEKQHFNLLSQLEKCSVKSSKVSRSEESKIYIPQFLKISPFDAGVTRNVKRGFSTLDALSVRTGVFLRRYPVARVFVFCYMVLLHLWVLFVLWFYVPSSSH